MITANKIFGPESLYSMAVENVKVDGIYPLVQLTSLLFGSF